MLQQQNRFERHPALTLAAIVLAVVGVADLTLTRWLRPPASILFDNSFRAPSPLYHHDLKPLQSLRTRWGPSVYQMATNSLGFRDRAPREVAPGAGGRRILIIGDSFTEGVGVDYAETFAGRVDDALRPQGVEVLNAGVSSYCAPIYRRKVQHLLDDVGLRFERLVVFLDLSDILEQLIYSFDSEGRVVSRYAKEEELAEGDHRTFAERADDFLRTHFTLLSAAFHPARTLRPLFGEPSGEGRWAVTQEKAMWTLDERLFETRGRRGLEGAARDLGELRRALAARGIAMTLAVYPWPVQVLKADLDSRQPRFWRAWAAANGVDFIDYFPVFIGHEDAATVLDRDFIRGDCHWTPTGHARVAEVLLARLREPAPAPGS